MTPPAGKAKERRHTAAALDKLEARLRLRLAALHATHDRLEIEQLALAERARALRWEIDRARRRLATAEATASEVAAHAAAARLLGETEARLIEVTWRRRQTAILIADRAQRARAAHTALRLARRKA